MVISVSLVFVLGIAVWWLHKYNGMKVWHGLICALFGFYLATSSFAPEIRNTITAIIHGLTGQGLSDSSADLQEVIPITQPHDYPDIDPQEVADTYDQATAATRHSHLARLWLRTATGRKIARALDLIPILATHVSRLRDRLAQAVADLGNLTAAARATLGAQREGEADPLYYLRDELDAQGQLPPDEQERP